MLGIVLTGHGEFAPGLAHSMQMIAGKQEFFKVVPFKEEDPIDDLEKNLKQVIEELLAETDGVVVFSDLLGGSPFKAAMMAAYEKENVEIICGTNLPMLIEASMARQFIESAEALAVQAVTTGRDGVQHVQMPTPTAKEDNEDEDGI